MIPLSRIIGCSLIVLIIVVSGLIIIILVIAITKPSITVARSGKAKDASFVFSAPSFTLSEGSLTAVADQWFPEPRITWTDERGTVLDGVSSFKINQAGIYSVETLLSPINTSQTYELRIENSLKIAVSRASITGSRVTQQTHFYDPGRASSASHSPGLTIMTTILLNGLITAS